MGTQDGNVVDPVSILAAEPSSNVNKKTPYPYDTPAEVDNPTVVPAAMLGKFHFTFLIRDPHYSIPSYYRCTIPPLDAITGFYDFYESEAGYDEVRRVFDYLRKIRLVGPHDANGNATATGASNGVYVNGDGVNGSAVPANTKRAEICVIDADDLLDDPAGIIKRYCKSVGIDYTPEMLTWNSEEDHEIAIEAFEKWRGFHEDAIHSIELKARNHVSFVLRPHSPPPENMYSMSNTDNLCFIKYSRKHAKLRLNLTKSGVRSTAKKERKSSVLL